jgi:fibronectin-binding autotransporter adhesin
MGTLIVKNANSYLFQGPAQMKLQTVTGDATVSIIGNHTINTAVNLGCNVDINVANSTGQNSLLTIAGVISDTNGGVTGNKNLTKTGNGSLLLTADNSYSGITIISAGQLELASGGNIAASSGIENNAIFLVSSGDHSVNKISGSGETRVLSGTLTAPSIFQSTLIVPSSGAANAVPEPSSLLLLVAGLLAIGAWLRRGHK